MKKEIEKLSTWESNKKKFKDIRLKLCLTKTDLAKMLGRSLPMVSKYENGYINKQENQKMFIPEIVMKLMQSWV